MKRLALVAVVLVAAVLVSAGCDDGGFRTVELGECAPPANAAALPLMAIQLPSNDCLEPQAGHLTLIESAAQWDAAFTCPSTVPPSLDLVTQRAAIVQVRCTPIDARFAAETAGDVVVGIYERRAGACIDPPLVFPLPRSPKPVRLARCQESCEGDCPTLP